MPYGTSQNLLVMGRSKCTHHSGSSELHLTVIAKGFEGVTQIKDDDVIHRLGQEQEHDTRLKLLLARTQPTRWPEVLIVTSTEFDKLQGKLAELFMGFHVNQGLLMEVEIVLARVVEIVSIVFLGGVSLWWS